MKNDDDAKKDEIEEQLEEPARNASQRDAGGEIIEEDKDNELAQKLEETETKFKRALADYQNLEKRVVEDRREWIRSANKDLLLRLLPVLDTLMLAAKHDKNKTLEISIGQFLDILKSEGVTRVETVGKKFDPNTMECVTIIDGDEGKVVEEVRSGFMLSDKLLRAAQVIVGGKK